MARPIISDCTDSFKQARNASRVRPSPTGDKQRLSITRKFLSKGMRDYMRKTGMKVD